MHPRSVVPSLFLLILCFNDGMSHARSGEQTVPGQQIEEAPSVERQVELKLREIEQLQLQDPELEIGSMVREVLHLSLARHYQEGYLDGLLHLGNHFIRRDLPDSAMVPIREGLSLTEDEEYRFRFLRQGGQASRLQGNALTSIRYFHQAIELVEGTPHTSQIPRLFYELALSYSMLGDYSSTFEYLYRSMARLEQGSEPETLVLVLLEIGQLYREFDNAEEGLWYLNEAERISMDHAFPDIHARSLLQLGISHLELGDQDQAEIYLEQAMSASRSVSERVMAGYNLGLLHLDRNEPELARGRFSEALEISRRNQDPEGVYYNSMGMGDLEREDGRYNNAVAWFESALEISRTIHSDPLIEQALRRKYQAYRDFGDAASALGVLEELNEYTDNLRAIEYERARAEYEARFESRRQEQQNRLLVARQAEQEALIRLQQGIGIGGIILLLALLGMTFTLYGNVRTRKRLNEHLQESNRELEQLNRVKNKLFAVVAHDLRGPLNSLKGLLYLFREKKVDAEKLVELTKKLEQNLQDNASTMENLLTWARSQMSGIQLNYNEFEVASVVEEVVSQLRPTASQKGVEIIQEVDEAFRFSADVDVLRLVLRNLLSNAIKFCSSGQRVTIRAARQKTELLTSVIDNGQGIRPEDREKIFDDSHHTTKGTGNEKGSGLGLLLCKEFVEKHGGEIGFESRYGEGTEFWFRLPERVSAQA